MAGPTTLLVPMDGSPLSKQALHVALEEYPDGDVTVLHVIDPTTPGYSYALDIDLDREPLHASEDWYERSEELAEQLFDDARDIAEEHDRELTTATAVGEPGRQIVAFATDHDIEQIVVGRHGRDSEDSQLLGSVTESIMFRSPVRVLMVQ